MSVHQAVSSSVKRPLVHLLFCGGFSLSLFVGMCVSQLMIHPKVYVLQWFFLLFGLCFHTICWIFLICGVLLQVFYQKHRLTHSSHQSLRKVLSSTFERRGNWRAKRGSDYIKVTEVIADEAQLQTSVCWVQNCLNRKFTILLVRTMGIEISCWKQTNYFS